MKHGEGGPNDVARRSKGRSFVASDVLRRVVESG